MTARPTNQLLYNVDSLEVLPPEMATPLTLRGTYDFVLSDGTVITDRFSDETGYEYHEHVKELVRALGGHDYEQARFTEATRKVSEAEKLLGSLSIDSSDAQASNAQTLRTLAEMGRSFSIERAMRLANYVAEAGGLWVRPADSTGGVARLAGLATIERPEFVLVRPVVEGTDGNPYLLQPPDLSQAKIYLDKKLLAK